MEGCFMDRRLLGVATASLIFGCSAAWIATLPACASSASKPAENAASDGTEFHTRILEIARSYKAATRVSDQSEWSPMMCQGPPPPGALHSSSQDSDTHGRKLYLLYAGSAAAYDLMSDWGLGMLPIRDFSHLRWDQDLKKHSRAYEAEIERERSMTYQNPIGQFVVKEAFNPVEVTDAELVKELKQRMREAQARRSLTEEFVQYREHQDGRVFRTGDPAGLFIMLKLDPKTPNTDEGWVYAVTTPDNSEVIRAGVIESCMECHKTTTRDRLYGHRWSWGPWERR
jgi:hypothetical protein